MRKILLTFFLLLTPALAQGTPIEIISVTDGDTLEIKINNKTEKLRLIGIDAPENKQEPFGQQAKNQLLQFISNGDNTLELDIQERDQYGRILGYLYNNDQLVNLKMLESGWATVLTIPPNIKHVQDFLTAQKTAQAKQIGIWDSTNPLKCMPQDFRQGECITEKYDGLKQNPNNDETLYFNNCNAARRAGKAPILKGQAGYRPALDGDNDGIACE